MAAPGAGSAVAARQAETWSLVEEAARRWILKCSDQRAWVPRREIYDETWGGFLGWERFLGLMREVEALRRRADEILLGEVSYQGMTFMLDPSAVDLSARSTPLQSRSPLHGSSAASAAQLTGCAGGLARQIPSQRGLLLKPYCT
eukprot:COSAG06_NODE_27252_length_597_cov_0.532129_2_plen_144_part_01